MQLGPRESLWLAGGLRLYVTSMVHLEKLTTQPLSLVAKSAGDEQGGVQLKR